MAAFKDNEDFGSWAAASSAVKAAGASEGVPGEPRARKRKRGEEQLHWNNSQHIRK